MNRLDFNQGLQAACRYLEGTAADLEQRLPERRIANARLQATGGLGWQVEKQAISSDQAKADLLRGQIKNIKNDLTK